MSPNAGADGSGHRRGADHAHDSDREAPHNSGQSLRQKNAPDDMPAMATRGLRGLDEAAVNLAQADFGDPSDVEKGSVLEIVDDVAGLQRQIRRLPVAEREDPRVQSLRFRFRD